MQKKQLSSLFYILIAILILVSFYVIFSYNRFVEIQFISAIIVLFLVLLIFKYFTPQSIITKIFKILIICLGLFYSGMITGNRFLSFQKIQNYRTKINSQTSVNFEKKDFKASLAKAKKENKLIFLDIYTGWCGPCVRFSTDILTDGEVSKMLNSKFINVKYDAEVGEGIEIGKKYDKGYYPTVLILDSDGNIKEELSKSDVHNLKTFRALLEKYQ